MDHVHISGIEPWERYHFLLGNSFICASYPGYALECVCDESLISDRKDGLEGKLELIQSSNWGV